MGSYCCGMNSEQSKNIIRDLAKKYGLEEKLVGEIVKYQFGFLLKKIETAEIKYDEQGNIVSHNLPLIFLKGWGKFVVSNNKLSKQEIRMRKIIKTRLELLKELKGDV